MKEMFRGLIQYTDIELEELWNTAHFVIDTNILLNFFKYTSKQTYQSVFEILEKLKLEGRLYVPHHVALEYLYNYKENMTKQEKGLDDLVKKLSETANLVDKYFAEIKSTHPYINEEIFEFYKENLKTSNSQLEIKKNELIKDLPDMNEIHIKVLNLLEELVGRPFTQDEINQIESNGKVRFEKRIPPGWKDNSKDAVRIYGDLEYHQRYGDLIVWKQIIRYAEEKQCSIIFITEDNKEDWWNKQQGKILGPQPNLVQEFWNSAGQLFYMYRVDRFVEKAKEYLGLEITEQVVSDITQQVENIRNQDKHNDNDISTIIEIKNKSSDMTHDLLSKSKRKKFIQKLISTIDDNEDDIDFEDGAMRNKNTGILYSYETRFLIDLFNFEERSFFNESINEIERLNLSYKKEQDLYAEVINYICGYVEVRLKNSFISLCNKLADIDSSKSLEMLNLAEENYSRKDMFSRIYQLWRLNDKAETELAILNGEFI